MRISDWSSDVCSSDLQAGGPQWSRGRLGLSRWRPFSSRRTGSGDPDARSSGFLLYGLPDFRSVDDLSGSDASGREPKQRTDRASSGWNDDFRERKRVVQGQRVSVRVDLGVGRLIKKKQNRETKATY